MQIQNGNKLIIDTLSATTYENLPSFQTTVEVTTIVYQSPQEIITVVTRPLPTPDAPPVVYTQRSQVVVPPPIHIIKYLNKMNPDDMVKRLCGGSAYPTNSFEVRCANCVRAYAAANPDASTGDYTQSNTGCNTRGIPHYDKHGILKGYR